MPAEKLASPKFVACLRRVARLVVLPLLVGGCAIVASPGGDAAPAGETGSDNPAIDAIFTSFDQPRSPGCALAVAQAGELIYARGYGYANLDYDIPITPQTVFDVGSVTKQFTAASISMLALEGKLSLDDNVRKWLPELGEYEWPITLRHMLHHTSGLRDYLNLFPLAGRGDYYPISHAQILAMMSRQRALIFPPGERYEYSNTAFMLLAQVLERAGGRSLGEMAQERIFDPLGMKSSFMYENFEEIIPRRATGYDRDSEGRLRIVHNYNFDVTGDGQLYTTMENLLRWDDYLHGDEKPEIHGLMLIEGHLNNGDPIGYAQGIELNEYRDLRTVGHSGSSWGFNTQLVRFLDTGLSIAISCNAGYASAERLAEQVANHYLTDQLGPGGDLGEKSEGDAGEAPSTPLVADAGAISPSLTTDQLQQLTGDFFAPELDATYRFAVEDGGLVVRIEQEPPFSVTPVTDDELAINFLDQGLSGPQPATLQLERNAAGRVTGFQLDSGSERGIVFVRR
jgi:CubicO group peptidase (beta-lactamase class C family)